VHVPVEAAGLNLYGIAHLEGADAPEDVGGALRAELLVGRSAEVTATVAARKDEPLRLGASLSAGVWLFDVKAEVALLHDVHRPRTWTGTLDLARGVLPVEKDRSGDWIPQATAGAEIGLRWSDDDTLYVGAEYFFNDLGQGDARLYPWLLFQADFVPLYVGRHYGATYLAMPSPGAWNDTTLTLSALGNFSDRSFLARFDWRVRVLTYLDLRMSATYAWGDNGELHLGVDVPPVPGIPELADGLHVAPTVLSLGVGAILSL
jgi:hypothetical protein